MISRMIGFLIMAGGAFYVYRGYESSQSVQDQVLKMFAGELSQQTLIYYGGGLAALVVGALVAFSSKPG